MQEYNFNIYNEWNFNINFPQLRQIAISCSAEDIEVLPTPPELLEKIEAMDIFIEANCHFWEALKADVVTCAFYRNREIFGGKRRSVDIIFRGDCNP